MSTEHSDGVFTIYLTLHQNKSRGIYLLSEDLGHVTIFSFPNNIHINELVEILNRTCCDMIDYNNSNCNCCKERWTASISTTMEVKMEEIEEENRIKDYIVHHQYNGKVWLHHSVNVPKDLLTHTQVKEKIVKMSNLNLHYNDQTQNAVWIGIPKWVDVLAHTRKGYFFSRVSGRIIFVDPTKESE